MIMPVAWDEPSLNSYRRDQLFRNLALLEDEIRESGFEAVIATRFDEVLNNWKSGRISVVLEGEFSLGYDTGLLRLLRRIGLRVLGLTWNQRNQIGDRGGGWLWS